MMHEVGFIGTGLMGAPMAANLVRAGVPLVVWNRTRSRLEGLRALGAQAADSADEVFARSSVVFLMLADEAAVDAVVGRGSTRFSANVVERTIVQMGTMAPGFSRDLERDVLAARGRYVEAPVSGSRLPAERGGLVAMLAGSADAVARVRPLVSPMTRAVVECGAVPSALLTKLAVNLFLITMVTGLAETVQFAQAHGLDLSLVAEVLDSGPMASDVSVGKLSKLARRDFDAQAAVKDVYKNARLIGDAAAGARLASPLLEATRALFRSANDELGLGAEDMAAVLKSLEARTASLTAGGSGAPGATATA